MGTLEYKHSKQLRNTQIQIAVLSSVKIAGLLAVAAIAPNALRYLGIIDRSARRKKARSIRAAKQRLLDNNLLCIRDGHYELTPKGELFLLNVENGKYEIKKPKKWDARWRVLIFDISEQKKPVREKLRRTLIHVGCMRLQDSVWIYPYDCEDLIALLKVDFQIGKDLIYMIVEHLENDSKLRNHFGLSL